MVVASNSDTQDEYGRGTQYGATTGPRAAALMVRSDTDSVSSLPLLPLPGTRTE